MPFIGSEQLLKLKDDAGYSHIDKEDGGGEAEPPMELPVHPPSVTKNSREYSLMVGSPSEGVERRMLL